MSLTFRDYQLEKYRICMYDMEFIIHMSNKRANNLSALYVIQDKLKEIDYNLYLEWVNNEDAILYDILRSFFSKVSREEKSYYISKAHQYQLSNEDMTNCIYSVQRNLIKNDIISSSSNILKLLDISSGFLYYLRNICLTRDILYNMFDTIPFIQVKDKKYKLFIFENMLHYGLDKKEIKKKLENINFINNISNNEFKEYDDILKDFDIDMDNYEKIEKDREISNDVIEDFLQKRFDYMYQRCLDNNWVLPKIELYRDVLLDNYTNKHFKCYYCGVLMRFKANKNEEYKDLFTFEHKKPLSKKGVHSKDNLTISCMCCNIIKSDMDEDLFLSVIKNLPNNKKYELYEYHMEKNNKLDKKFKKYNEKIQKLESENNRLKVENKLLVQKM